MKSPLFHSSSAPSHRGWRRSGLWLYQPQYPQSCCRLLTIRLDAHKFAPDKHQRKTQKRWDAYLAGGAKSSGSLGSSTMPMDEDDGGEVKRRATKTANLVNSTSIKPPQTSPPPPTPAALAPDDFAAALAAAWKRIFSKLQLSDAGAAARNRHKAVPSFLPPAPLVSLPTVRQRRAPEGASLLLSSSYPLVLSAGLARSFREAPALQVPAQELAGMFADCSELPDSCVLRARNGFLNLHRKGASDGDASVAGSFFFRQARPTSTSRAPLSSRAPVPRCPNRQFEIRTVPSSQRAELIQTEFSLFKRYQVEHHGDAPAEVSRSSFARFLCDTPVEYQTVASPEGPLELGSFHQQYWLDGALVAVGVVDVLPRCLSSKYLFWDPALGELSLGKVSSLLEIAWVRKAARKLPSLHWYYLGYYLASCPRMAYKGSFKPSDVLCPATGAWVSLASVQQAIPSMGKAVSLVDLEGATVGGAGKGKESPAPEARSFPSSSCPDFPEPREVEALRLAIRRPTRRNCEAAAESDHAIISFSQLGMAGLLPPAALEKLRKSLTTWARAVGPSARQMAYAV